MYHQFNIQEFYVHPTQGIYVFCVDLRKKGHNFNQWRTEGGLGCSNPPPRNSEDIGGVLDRKSKKYRRLDFLL